MPLPPLLAPLALALLAPALGASPCPPDPAGHAVLAADRFLGAKDPAGLATLRALATACPEAGPVQYVAAVTLTAAAASLPPTAPARIELLPAAYRAWVRTLRTQETWKDGPVKAPDGKTRPLGRGAAERTRAVLVRTLVATERATGIDVVSPILQAFPDHCPEGLEAQQVSFAFEELGPTPGGFALLERVVACKDPIPYRHVHHARALLAAARFEADPARKLALLDRAEAAARAHLGKREGDSFWGPFEWGKLRDARAEASPDPPEAEWFLPGTLGLPQTRRAIARDLDRLWVGGKDPKAWTPYGSRIYVLKARAEASADPRQALATLYFAAKDHATGRVRRPESKELAPPPDFFWKPLAPPGEPRDSGDLLMGK